MKNILIKICALLIILSPSFTLAQALKLPEVMVGGTTVKDYRTTTVTNSSSGHSLLFNGNNYVSVNKTPSTYSTLVGMAWVKPAAGFLTYNGGNSNQTVLSEGGHTTLGGVDSGWAMGFSVSGSSTVKLKVSLRDTAFQSTIQEYPVTNLTDGKWHHIAFFWRNNGRFDLYFDDQVVVDNIPVGLTGTQLVPDYSGGPTTYLNISRNAFQGFVGNIDEPRIYSSAPANRQDGIKQSGQVANAEKSMAELGFSFGQVVRYMFSEGVNALTCEIMGCVSKSGTLTPAPPLESAPKWQENVGVGTTTEQTLKDTYYGGFTGNEVGINYHKDTGQTVGQKLEPSLGFNGERNSSDRTRNPAVDYSYVDCGNGPSITGTGEFTVSTWVKRERATFPAPLDPDNWTDDLIEPRDFIMSQGKGMYGDYYIYFNKNDQVVLRTWGHGQSNFDGPSGEGLDLYSSRKIKDNEWHNIVVIRNQDGVSGKIWIDGADVTVAVPGTPSLDDGVLHKIYLTAGPVQGYVDPVVHTTIGALSWRIDNPPLSEPLLPAGPKENTPYPFKGNIDNVRTYTRAITDQEVKRLYSATSTSADNAGLKGFWKFNEGSGNLAIDASGNGNNCTLINTEWSLEDGPVAVDDAYITNDGYDLFGFDGDTLVGCVGKIILNLSPYRCFVTNSNENNINVMTSRTYIGSDYSRAVNEVAALSYPAKPLIAGDAYIGSSDPNNFAYWGRNLVQGSSAAKSNDTFWGLSGYTLNPNAEASLNVDGTEYKKYRARIDQLKAEAGVAGHSSLPSLATWMMQGSTIDDAALGDVGKFPEGKVWKYDDSPDGNLTVNLNTTYTYKGVGTIIVPGDLTIKSGVKIKPAIGITSQLGIIVLGKVYIKGNNEINATILCLDSDETNQGINFQGDNVNLIGSFVSTDFQFGTPPYNNIRFYYDKKLKDSAPPGFKDLNLGSQTPKNN